MRAVSLSQLLAEIDFCPSPDPEDAQFRRRIAREDLCRQEQTVLLLPSKCVGTIVAFGLKHAMPPRCRHSWLRPRCCHPLPAPPFSLAPQPWRFRKAAYDRSTAKL